MTSRIHTQGGTNTFKFRVHNALSGPLSQRAQGFPPASPGQPASGEKVEVCLGEVRVDRGKGTKQDSSHRNGCHSYPTLQMGSRGTVGLHHQALAGAPSPPGLLFTWS